VLISYFQGWNSLSLAAGYRIVKHKSASCRTRGRTTDRTRGRTTDLITGWLVCRWHTALCWLILVGMSHCWEGLSKSSEHAASKPKFERGRVRQGTAKSSSSMLRCENPPKTNYQSNNTCLYRIWSVTCAKLQDVNKWIILVKMACQHVPDCRSFSHY